MRILHLASRDEWAQAKVDGWYRGSTAGTSLAEVGFVHLSTASQLPGVLERFYADADLSALVLLVVDPAVSTDVGSPLKWERADGGAGPFPHIYGPIPVGAAVAEFDLRRSDGGAPVLPDLTAFDVFTDPPAVD